LSPILTSITNILATLLPPAASLAEVFSFPTVPVLALARRRHSHVGFVVGIRLSCGPAVYKENSVLGP
jgi:hypothetical protein